MKTFLYVLKAVRLGMLTEGPSDSELPILTQHGAYLNDLSERGIVVLYGRTQNNDASTMGLVVFEAEDESAAQSIMNSDPAITGGVMTGELFPYKISFLRSA